MTINLEINDMKNKKIPIRIIYYNDKNPLTTTGGVQTFARGLKSIFDRVEYMTPKNLDLEYILRERIPVICTNEMVSDIPENIPVIGFQHGVGAIKYLATKSSGHRKLKKAQMKASKRENIIWIACADWIASTFKELYGNQTKHVIYHQIDTETFDGKLENDNSCLILHDARTRHKGSTLLPIIETAFPEWNFESLNCQPEDVPERMRKAKAFIHLSKYEGNSIVCNEAMAMNLPCMFTNVGLMKDENRPKEVYLLDLNKIYKSYFGIKIINKMELIHQTGLFIKSLNNNDYNPRKWVLENAVASISNKKWEKTILDFQELSGWSLL
ncbi:MAG: hypothetical protein CMF94_05240 [Candidatus Marinimicrobia bacterium]|nr:hypothetical protein [Candidatus Neomarinimicrobiota bacterium]